MAEKRKLFEEVGATAQVAPQGGLIEGNKGARRGIRAWLVALFLLVAMMIAVGGLTEFADGNKATIIRASENNKRYSVRLQDLVKRGDISANVDMLPGDILIIPQGWF